MTLVLVLQHLFPRPCLKPGSSSRPQILYFNKHLHLDASILLGFISHFHNHCLSSASSEYHELNPLLLDVSTPDFLAQRLLLRRARVLKHHKCLLLGLRIKKDKIHNMWGGVCLTRENKDMLVWIQGTCKNKIIISQKVISWRFILPFFNSSWDCNTSLLFSKALSG